MRITPFAVALASVTLVLGACSSEQRATSSDTLAADATTDEASPMSLRDRMRQERWNEAVRDLDFSAGRVVVRNAPPTEDRDRARRFVRDGHELRNMNHRTESIAAYADAVRAAPSFANAYFFLGQAMITKGKSDLALACFETAYDLDPSHIEALQSVAESLALEGRHAEAIARANDVLALEPDFGPAHHRLAVWHYYERDMDLAWIHLRRAEETGHPAPPQLESLLRQNPSATAAVETP